MVLQIKCPDCGADMLYDADSGLLKCPSCGKTKEVGVEHTENSNDANPNDTNSQQETYHNEKASENNVDETFGDFEEFTEKTTYGTYGDNEVSHYVCQNCGAELVTDADTTSTTCSYCGAPMILNDKLSGAMAPAKIIPFTISKEKAEEAFKKWCRHGLFSSKEFMKVNRIKEVSGMYVPFWLYDVNGQGELYALAERTHTHREGDYRVTETEHFHIYRKVSLNFNSIPVDASEKMPDDMMDKLEPFSYANLEKFEAPYLAGYLAENYNYTAQDMFPRVEEKTNHYIESFIQSTISGYSSVNVTQRIYNARQRDAAYTLLPVWLFTYNFEGKDYMFAMNGQTGKVVGKPPIYYPKVILWWLILTVGLFLISFGLTLALGGGL